MQDWVKLPKSHTCRHEVHGTLAIKILIGPQETVEIAHSCPFGYEDVEDWCDDLLEDKEYGSFVTNAFLCRSYEGRRVRWLTISDNIIRRNQIMRGTFKE